MAFSSDERVQQNAERNAQRKSSREQATELLTTEEKQKEIIDKIGEGGVVGRRLQREVRKYAATGRVSSWLAGQVLEDKTKGQPRYDSTSERSLVSTQQPIVSLPQAPAFDGLQKKKPVIDAGESAEITKAWDIYVVNSTNNSYTVKVRPSTVSNILPENWDDTFICNATNLYYGKVIIQTDGISIIKVEIDVTTSEPAFQQSRLYEVQSPVEIPFGMFIGGQSFNLTNGGDIPAQPKMVFASQPSSPVESGVFPLDLYYLLKQ